MIDAWTQTSDRGSDNEDAKRHRVASATAIKSKHSQPIQSNSFSLSKEEALSTATGDQ